MPYLSIVIPLLLPALRAALLPGGLLLLTGCGVYYPHTPVTPLLEARGQTEVRAVVHPFSIFEGAPVVEASGAWAPVPHLTVLATGGGNWLTNRHPEASAYWRERQAGLGIGGHTTVGGFYFGLLGGANRHKASVGTKGGPTALNQPDSLYSFNVHCDARFTSYYGQAYFACHLSEATTLIAYARRTWLHYQSIEQEGTVAGQLRRNPPDALSAADFSRHYLELGVGLRVGRGPWQVAFDVFGTQSLRELPVGRRTGTGDFTTAGATIMALGVVLRPHLLGQKRTAPPTQ